MSYYRRPSLPHYGRVSDPSLHALDFNISIRDHRTRRDLPTKSGEGRVIMAFVCFVNRI